MTPRKMLIGHDPANGRWGDCFRCCIASLLDLSAIDVPHFMDGNNPDGHEEARAWLQERGHDWFEIPLTGDDIDSIHEAMKRWWGGRHYVVSGTSPRGVNHCVVCRDGEIVHDPTHHESGLVGPCDDGYFWVGVVAVAL